MHIIAELDRRLTEVRMLLKLEEEHLARVRALGLDDADAQWLIELRRRYLKRLEEQRGVIVHRRLMAHKAQAQAAVHIRAEESEPVSTGEVAPVEPAVPVI